MKEWGEIFVVIVFICELQEVQTRYKVDKLAIW